VLQYVPKQLRKTENGLHIYQLPDTTFVWTPMMAVRGHIFILDFAVVVEVVLLFKMSISLIFFWGGG